MHPRHPVIALLGQQIHRLQMPIFGGHFQMAELDGGIARVFKAAKVSIFLFRANGQPRKFAGALFDFRLKSAPLAALPGCVPPDS